MRTVASPKPIHTQWPHKSGRVRGYMTKNQKMDAQVNVCDWIHMIDDVKELQASIGERYDPAQIYIAFLLEELEQIRIALRKGA